MPKIEITESKGLVQLPGNGDIAFGLKSLTAGPGAISTEVAPATRVSQINDEIVTTIAMDLTGLKKKSDVGDVIGLDGVDGAYLLQYKTATHGILHRVEVSCLELPTGTNVLKDFDLITASSATLKFDDDASGGTSILAMGGNIVKGEIKELFIAGSSTNNHYLYLCEGATSTNAQVFTAGKLVIRLFGHKSF
jgi:hypothetical protein